MVRVALTILMALSSVPALAFEYGTVHMTCSQARAMVNNTGWITVQQGGQVVDLEVTGLAGVTVPFGTHCYVRAADNANCLVGYIANDWDSGK
jgi:hypothetical protein